MSDDRSLPRPRWYLAALLTIVGVLALGGHVASMAAPIAQQTNPEELWDAYPLDPGEAGSEPADPAPTPTAAATRASGRAAATPEEGSRLSGPALIGGAAAAFVVGLGAGQLWRRRRRTAAAVAAFVEAQKAKPELKPARPAPAAEPPPPPVPEPPPPVTPPPRLVVIPVPESEPPPPPPAPPERAPTAEALPGPERPAPADAPSPETPLQPLHDAPERPVERADIPAAPRRRFARRMPWPAETADLWTCEVDWNAGYLKSAFRAMAAPPGEHRRKSIAESPPIKWTFMSDPEPPTAETAAALGELVAALANEGWERIESAGPWYALRFVWHREGQPRPIAPLTGKATNA